MNSLILQTASRLLVVLLAVYSVFILLRGHDEPGGGFIGGLLIASAFALHSLAFGGRAASELLRVNPVFLIGLGLLFSAGSGTVSLLLGMPAFTGLWSDFQVPGLPKFSTVLIFDVGVYLVVWGTTYLILHTLGHRTEQVRDSSPDGDGSDMDTSGEWEIPPALNGTFPDQAALFPEEGR